MPVFFRAGKRSDLRDNSAHYEYDDNYLMTTFRSFSEVLNPDPGYGICKEILPGYEYVGDHKVN